jgi:hypothetical protein
MFAQNKGMI